MLESLGLSIDLTTDGKDTINKVNMNIAKGKIYDNIILNKIIPGGFGALEIVSDLRKSQSLHSIVL